MIQVLLRKELRLQRISVTKAVIMLALIGSGAVLIATNASHSLFPKALAFTLYPLMLSIFLASLFTEEALEIEIRTKMLDSLLGSKIEPYAILLAKVICNTTLALVPTAVCLAITNVSYNVLYAVPNVVNFNASYALLMLAATVFSSLASLLISAFFEKTPLTPMVKISAPFIVVGAALYGCMVLGLPLFPSAALTASLVLLLLNAILFAVTAKQLPRLTHVKTKKLNPLGKLN